MHVENSLSFSELVYVRPYHPPCGALSDRLQASIAKNAFEALPPVRSRIASTPARTSLLASHWYLPRRPMNRVQRLYRSAIRRV